MKFNNFADDDRLHRDKDRKKNTAIGSHITSLREEKGWTIVELTNKVSSILGTNISDGTIGSIESGEIETPSEPMIGALARALGTSKEALIGKLPEDDNEPGPPLFSDGSPHKFQVMPGGEFVAVKEENGTYTILDVPVFAENSRFGKDFSLSWLLRAVKKSKDRMRQDNYTAPLHVNHTGEDRPKKRIGTFALTRVGKMTYEGKTVNAAFADFLNISEEDFKDIQQGKLPYRSVEIPPKAVDDPEIHSIALLDTDVPFFRMANMTIGEVKEIKNDPALAFCYNDDFNKNILFNFSENSKMKFTTAQKKFMATLSKKKLAKYIDNDEDEKKEMEDETKMQDDVDEKKKKNKDKDKDDKTMKNQDEIVAEPEVVEDPGPDKLEILIAMMTELMKKMNGDNTDKKAEPEDDDAARAPVQLAAKQKGEVAGILKALTGRLDKFEATAKREKAISSTVIDLAAYGIDKQDVLKFVDKNGNLDEAGLNGYAQAIKIHGRIDPPQTFDGTIETAPDSTPKEVLKYQADGPERMTEAMKYSQEYDELGAGYQQGQSLEAYIANRFDIAPTIQVHN